MPARGPLATVAAASGCTRQHPILAEQRQAWVPTPPCLPADATRGSSTAVNDLLVRQAYVDDTLHLVPSFHCTNNREGPARIALHKHHAAGVELNGAV